jgi:hypothetical protein
MLMRTRCAPQRVPSLQGRRLNPVTEEVQEERTEAREALGPQQQEEEGGLLEGHPFVPLERDARGIAVRLAPEPLTLAGFLLSPTFEFDLLVRPHIPTSEESPRMRRLLRTLRQLDGKQLTIDKSPSGAAKCPDSLVRRWTPANLSMLFRAESRGGLGRFSLTGM